MKEISLEYSCIKGYHHFKRRTHNEIEMVVEEDNNNVHGHTAMIVRMPQVNNISAQLLDIVVQEAIGKEEQQTVRVNAGKIIGHVPANLFGVFRN